MQDATAANTGEDLVLLARLVRPQGRHGEILADILTDFPERFAERKRLILTDPRKPAAAPREIALERHWLHKGRVVLKFAGVDSINDAEPLRGLDVSVPRRERATLEDDAVYIADLIGCRVFDFHSVSDRPSTTRPALAIEVGEIIDVDRESPAHPLLVVQSALSGEVLIPFVKAFLVRIDLPNKRIEMDLPEGLLELNTPLSTEERTTRRAEQEASETALRTEEPEIEEPEIEESGQD